MIVNLSVCIQKLKLIYLDVVHLGSIDYEVRFLDVYGYGLPIPKSYRFLLILYSSPKRYGLVTCKAW